MGVACTVCADSIAVPQDVIRSVPSVPPSPVQTSAPLRLPAAGKAVPEPIPEDEDAICGAPSPASVPQPAAPRAAGSARSRRDSEGSTARESASARRWVAAKRWTADEILSPSAYKNPQDPEQSSGVGSSRLSSPVGRLGSREAAEKSLLVDLQLGRQVEPAASEAQRPPPKVEVEVEAPPKATPKRPLALEMLEDESVEAPQAASKRPSAVEVQEEEEDEEEGEQAVQPLVRDRPFSLASVDDVDDAFLSKSWSLNPDGLTHHPSGVQISTDGGVVVDGQAYKLSPEDIQLDEDIALGSGAGGVVHAGVHKPTGVRVAIKTVRVDSREKREQMLHEIKGLIQAAGCLYVVQWYAGFLTPNTSLVHVVLEYMNLGSLVDLRRRAGPGPSVPADPHVACIAAQIMLGLLHLQNNALLHRDIKPANVLHNRAGRVKLTDFGISKNIGGALSGVGTTFVGTTTYMSPERLEGDDHSYNSDVWSAGVVIYELATGQHPFQSNSFLGVYSNICEQDEPRLPADGNPAALLDLVARCLQRDATQRPDARALGDHAVLAFGSAAYVGSLARYFSELPGAGE
eukprot:TRINITY_DN5207_c0_g1_i1.p1 TRINITY_DN5207_c0_g1~~TRINITY_DN5207_c0_g1_i1.p1  ORF type:complete len:574 (+),score=122.75 TRINITY_DN5207_c0_g1_i1:34-1755(+)